MPDLGGAGQSERWARLRKLGADLSTIGILAILLLAVNVLPPDTSLADLQKAGVLRVCVPAAYPPLVTGEPAAPGFDIELVQKLATSLGVRLELSTNPAMGRDFNPRSWRVTRAQCAMLVGGVVTSALTRSFLDVSPSYLRTGWSVVSKSPLEGLSGLTVGFFPGLTGLDRIALSRQMRSGEVKVRLYQGTDLLATAISSGEVDAGLTEALSADQLAVSHGWHARMLPPPLEQYGISLGLWRGDLTLKRRVSEILGALHADGEMQALAAKYGIASELE